MSATPAPTKEMIDKLRKEVSDYTPGIGTELYPVNVKCPDRLFIGLFGRTGCGKTSLINSLKFSALGELRQSEWYQAAGQDMTGGHTMNRSLAAITRNIFVIDNRGGYLNTVEAIKEVNAQLDGRRGYSERVEWQSRYTSDDESDLDDIDIDLKIGDPIGCAVFVFNARHYINSTTNQIYITDVIQLRDVIASVNIHQGRYPMAVITHVDVAEKKAVVNLKAILRSSGVSEIFEVANLTNKKKILEEHYQHVLLLMLSKCMADADQSIIFKHYRQKEEQRKERIRREREEKRRRREDEVDRRLQEAIREVKEDMRQMLQDEQRAHTNVNEKTCTII